MVFSNAAMLSVSNWDVTAEEDGIVVYSRFNGDDAIKEVKVEMEIDVEMETFVAFLNDVPAYTSWVYKCKEAKLVESISNDSFVYYTESDFPFPVSNRDMVILSKQTYDPVLKKVTASSVAVPDKMPEKKGLVRIKEFESTWQITEIATNKLKIEYQAKTDPAGFIPAWVVNLAIGTAPLKTMKALRKQLEE